MTDRTADLSAHFGKINFSETEVVAANASEKSHLPNESYHLYWIPSNLFSKIASIMPLSS